MHRKRFPFFPKGKHRKLSSSPRFSLRNSLEKTLIRVMALGAVLLAVFQLGTITNPVDFYLQVAGDIDYPAFQYEEYTNSDQLGDGKNSQTIRLDFQAEPSSPVLVKQNEKTLGVIGTGISIEVQPGEVSLDASGLPYPVTVQIVLNEKSYHIELNGDIKSFNIQLKTNSSS